MRFLSRVLHEKVTEGCLQHQVPKALGKGDEMVNARSGKDWIPEWETKVVMGKVTKAQICQRP